MDFKDWNSKDWRYRLEYVAARFGDALLRTLPESVAVATAQSLTLRVGRRTRFDRRMCDNLAAAGFDPASVRRIADDAWRNLGCLAADFSIDARREAVPMVEGIEHLPAGGALLVSAHAGFWEAIRTAARHAGRPVGLYYRRFNNPYAEAFIRKRLRPDDAPLMTKGAAGTRTLLRTLKAGGRVLLLADQRISGAPEGMFFGRPAATSWVPAEMALRAGVPMVPVFAHRVFSHRLFAHQTGAGCTVRFQPPIAPDTPEVMMQQLLDRTQAHIMQHPGEWFWMHSRWKPSLGAEH